MTEATAVTGFDRDIDGRRAFLGIDADTERDLKTIRALLEREIPRGLDHFYAKVKATPETAAFFSGDAHMGQAKNAQVSHWGAIAEGKFDDAYAERVNRIGSIHADIGLLPRWYIGGYGTLTDHLVHAILREYWPRFGLGGKAGGDRVASILSSLLRAIYLDMDLSLSVYFEKAEAARQTAKVEEARQASQAEAIAQERDRVCASFGKAIARLAEKNLDCKVTGDMPQAYQDLRNDFNQAIAGISRAIDDIGTSAETINSGSGEISIASDDLSRRAEQHAASVEEASATLATITDAVRTMAERAEKSGRLVNEAKGHGETSQGVVREAVSAMEKIDQSSSKISKIIGVIDDIAFQTNLLALNAGVEAARAGDAGKGFGVVAQEVRELAQRSAQAAKEIKSLITGSVNEVKNGVSLVRKTGAAMSEIVSRVNEVAGDMEATIADSRDQALRLEELNGTISVIDQGTQQNAAMAEQMTAASHSLKSEIAQIDAMLRSFRHEDQSGPSCPASLQRAAPSAVRPAVPRPASGSPVPALKTTSTLAPAADENWVEF
ncbi:globin-coupled sensor protein [Zhengella mangrovi]|uniref:Globin-coupled sensor protein n=1 Tax=Zhengella mangrovi TaxID=1982044 RepID=A0A2G1QL36_9HYPH|nr:globin-coupled sensor protein [Zhengella mangrovi]PHP65928.1 globin-coupled sensor protein [Zhengella mangrovi]